MKSLDLSALLEKRFLLLLVLDKLGEAKAVVALHNNERLKIPSRSRSL